MWPYLAVLELAPTTAKAGAVKNLRAVASVAIIASGLRHEMRWAGLGGLLQRRRVVRVSSIEAIADSTEATPPITQLLRGAPSTQR